MYRRSRRQHPSSALRRLRDTSPIDALSPKNRSQTPPISSQIVLPISPTSSRKRGHDYETSLIASKRQRNLSLPTAWILGLPTELLCKIVEELPSDSLPAFASSSRRLLSVGGYIYLRRVNVTTASVTRLLSDAPRAAVMLFCLSNSCSPPTQLFIDLFIVVEYEDVLTSLRGSRLNAVTIYIHHLEIELIANNRTPQALGSFLGSLAGWCTIIKFEVGYGIAPPRRLTPRAIAWHDHWKEPFEAFIAELRSIRVLPIIFRSVGLRQIARKLLEAPQVSSLYVHTGAERDLGALYRMLSGARLPCLNILSISSTACVAQIPPTFLRNHAETLTCLTLQSSALWGKLPPAHSCTTRKRHIDMVRLSWANISVDSVPQLAGMGFPTGFVLYIQPPSPFCPPAHTPPIQGINHVELGISLSEFLYNGDLPIFLQAFPDIRALKISLEHQDAQPDESEVVTKLQGLKVQLENLERFTCEMGEWRLHSVAWRRVE